MIDLGAAPGFRGWRASSSFSCCTRLRSRGPRRPRPKTAPAVSVAELARRLQRLEQQNAKLTEQNQALGQQLQAVTSRYDQLNQRLEQIEPRASLPTPTLPAAAPPAAESAAPARAEPALAKFLVGDYDDDRGAFVLVRPHDAQRVPFELRLDLFTQARYTNFARSVNTWTDSTGTPQPIRNYNAVEVTRNFIQFSGFGLDPRLQFTAILFSSTAINDTVYLGWINYHFNDAFDLRVGNWIVPGTREWFESFRYTLGADRLMATTFFRPNISPGIWAQGEPIKNVRYVAMLANSLNRFSQGIERVGNAPTFGGTLWWEPCGDFGPGPSDIENHESPALRLGTNLAVSHEANQGFRARPGWRIPKTPSCGSRTARPCSARARWRRASSSISTGIQLWTIDAAVKYRGVSLSGEYFFRWLDDFKQTGDRLPFRSLFDHGALLQGGFFLIPGKLEAFARTSFVAGSVRRRRRVRRRS